MAATRKVASTLLKTGALNCSRGSSALNRPFLLWIRPMSDSSGGGDMGGGDGSGSITYSGGQASSGQGGFYGSGGARALGKTQTKHRPEAVAHATDIKTLCNLMDEVHDLEGELHRTTDMPRKIQIKGTIKKKMTGKDMLEVLKRLELKGEPVWGLSVSERALVKEARRIFNSC